MQGVKDKEVIASELAAAEAHIGNTAFGQMLLRRHASLAMLLIISAIMCQSEMASLLSH